MNAKIIDNNLVITIPLKDKPELSKSGKSLVVATTSGNWKSDLKIDGKTVQVGLNAFIAAN